jgi:hypothetical protein
MNQLAFITQFLNGRSYLHVNSLGGGQSWPPPAFSRRFALNSKAA